MQVSGDLTVQASMQGCNISMIMLILLLLCKSMFLVNSLDRSMDALSIYTTYIALNAMYPVSMPDEIRQQIEGITCSIHNYYINMVGIRVINCNITTITRYTMSLLSQGVYVYGMTHIDSSYSCNHGEVTV